MDFIGYLLLLFCCCNISVNLFKLQTTTEYLMHVKLPNIIRFFTFLQWILSPPFNAIMTSLLYIFTSLTIGREEESPDQWCGSALAQIIDRYFQTIIYYWNLISFPSLTILFATSICKKNPHRLMKAQKRCHSITPFRLVFSRISYRGGKSFQEYRLFYIPIQWMRSG